MGQEGDPPCRRYWLGVQPEPLTEQPGEIALGAELQIAEISARENSDAVSRYAASRSRSP